MIHIIKRTPTNTTQNILILVNFCFQRTNKNDNTLKYKRVIFVDKLNIYTISGIN